MRSTLELRRFGSAALRYTFTAASVGIATGLALLSQYYQFHDLALPLLTLSVALTTWYAGVGPSILAVLLSMACFNFFFTEPVYTFYVSTRDLPFFLVFIIWAVVVAIFATVRRRVESNLLDARDRLQAEVEQRRQSEERFRAYAEVASDWLWETGPDHRFTNFSSSPSLGLGRVSEEFIGKRRWDLAPDRAEDNEKWREHIRILEAHQPFRGFTYKTSRQDGSEAYISVSGKPVFDAVGSFLGYRGVATDISAELRADLAERALRQAQTDLAHVSRVMTMGELAASVAHEISQPITAAYNDASAALRFLAVERPNLDEAREAIGCVVGDASRAADIIDRIRDHIRKAPPRKHNFDINAAITEVMALARSDVITNEVLVQTSFTEQLSPVLGDRVQLQQVILNLILNAVEAMRSVSDRPRELSISTKQTHADGVLVVVRDSGPGIDPENLERVFESFYTTKSGGVGIGLSICRSIIEAHGGRLWADANEPGGAVFRFSLPAGKQAS